MYSWLRRRCEGYSVAELSIAHSLIGSMGLLFLFMVSYPFGPVVWLTILGVWTVFMLWFWFGLVRCVWKSEREGLGISVFKILQYTFVVFLVFSLITSWEFQEGYNFIFSLIAIFDIAVGWLVFNFLLLVLFARCRLTWRDYFDIGSIFCLIIVQVWMTDFSMY